jgi:hypothetical protein
MALINQNMLFDRLKEYIDKKITNLPERVEEILIEYGFKIVAENIDSVKIVAENIDEVIVCANNIDYIIEVAQPEIIAALPEAAQNALDAMNAAWDAEAEALTADSYATEEINTFVKEWYSNGDGTFSYIETSHYSSFHWATVSMLAGKGLKLQGVWDLGAHTDPSTEPPAPVPLEDPDNPGNPLPYENGMYWYVVGESIYDPDGNGFIDPYPTFGPATGHYRTDDKIVYLADDSLPYNPWIRLLDVVSWHRLINVPNNVKHALNRFGMLDDARMLGSLEIMTANPGILLNEITTTDTNISMYSNDAGQFLLNTAEDSGMPKEIKFAIEPDAQSVVVTSSDITYGGNILWHEGNDGIGSGLDAGLFEGKNGSYYAAAGTNVITGPASSTKKQGFYYVTNTDTSDIPILTNDKGTLTVSGDGSTNVSQVVVDLASTVKSWVRTLDSGTWSPWRQLGYMEFDGTRLSITL